jgi:putative ABC transport system permease protein
MRPASLLKSLLREPRTALPALILLGLGIGGFAWMMALHRSLMIRSLPAPRPDRLVSLYNGMASMPDKHGTPSTGDLQLMRGFPEIFKGVAAWEPTNANLGLDVPVRVRLDQVTDNFFDVLEVRPALGRSFSPADDEAGAPPTLMVSHSAWRDRFGADPTLVGHNLSVNGQSAQVIGILPEGFHTAHGTELFRPFRWTAARRDNHGPHFLRVVARLRDGATLAQARAAMDQVAGRIRELFVDAAPKELLEQVRYGASPLIDDVLGQGLRVLRVLRLATALVLLLAAYNAASLLLARGLGRRNEMAVRSALGAQPAHLRRLLLMEGALLGFMGALGGLLVAHLSLGLTGQVLAWGFPDLALGGLSMDVPSLVAVAFMGPLLGAICALAAQPGNQVSNLLRTGGRSPSLAGPGRARRMLVGAQLILGGTLLIGALSLQHGLGRLMTADAGFNLDRVWSFQIQPGKQMPLAARTQLAQAITQRLNAQPGIQATGASNGLPMSGFRSDLNMSLPDGRKVDPEARAMTPGMVQALGLRLLRGRDLEVADGATAEKVMLVTRTLAQQAFGTDDVVGRHLSFGEQSFSIVGVLADVREFGPAQLAPPMFYVPLAQSDLVWNQDLYVAFRSTGPPPTLQQLQALLSEVAPGQALDRYLPMKDLLKAQLGPQRMALAFIGAFAGLALLLAAGGVFGIMAASVAARRAEFGVRSALGATPLSILSQILRETLRLAVLAGLAGVLVGGLLERLSREVLGDWPNPPLTLTLLALGALVGAAMAAALLPALRAARIDPAAALRDS